MYSIFDKWLVGDLLHIQLLTVAAKELQTRVI